MVVFVLLMETTETIVWFEQVAYITSLLYIFFLTVYHANFICIHVFILVYLVSIHSLSKMRDANLSLSRNSCFCYVIFFLGVVCHLNFFATRTNVLAFFYVGFWYPNLTFNRHEQILKKLWHRAPDIGISFCLFSFGS